MNPDSAMLMIRNILFVQLLTALALIGNSPPLQQELLKIWKNLNRPILPKRSNQTNHKSGKFWEIDMTDFEP